MLTCIPFKVHWRKCNAGERCWQKNSNKNLFNNTPARHDPVSTSLTLMGHFRINFSLFFKTRPGAQPFV